MCVCNRRRDWHRWLVAMKLTVPNIVKPIHLSEFAPEFGDACIHVWVNPRRELRTVLIEVILSDKATDESMAEWLSEIWSQGPEDSRMTAEDVKALALECAEKAPNLWSWLVTKTIYLLTDHYNTKKKS